MSRPNSENMEKKDRLIFVSNDDGYQARGFAAAIEVAREFGEVIAALTWEW